jgi:hypothetical protein
MYSGILGSLGALDQGIDPRTLGLLSTGLGMMQASGPSLRPTSFGQALGQAGMQGLGAYQQAQQSQQNNLLHRMQAAKLMSDLTDAEKQRAAIEEFAKSLPADKQAAFRANPKAFIEEMNKRYSVRPQGSLVTGSGQEIFKAPAAPQLLNREVAGESGPVNQSMWVTPGQAIPNSPKPVRLGFENLGPTVQPVNPYTGRAQGQGLRVGVSPNTAFSQGQENWRMNNRPILTQGVTADGNLGGVLSTPAQLAQQGGVLSTDLRPPAAATADIRHENTAANQLQRQFNSDVKPTIEQLGPISIYRQVRASGDNAQAATVAADMIRRASRSGNARFKGEVGALLGGGYGSGSIGERIENFVSQELAGAPSENTLKKLDALVERIEQGALEHISTQTSTYAGRAKARGIALGKVTGSPFVRGNTVIAPDGTVARFKTPAEAKAAAQKWVEENE